MQANGKPLYQPWSEEEFASDLYVRAMTPVQRWMYRSLLQAAFFCSTRPYLPDEDSLLWMLAGCENKAQWDSNKEVVRAMFQSVNLGGKQLLSQKRVLADWNRLLDKREALAERGRSGGLAKANQMLGSSLPREVKGSEVSESEVKESEAQPVRSLAKDENVPARVQELAAEILHYTKRLTPDEKKELVLLGRAFPGRVADDFAEWAASDGEGKAYPVAYYIRVANDRLKDGAATARAEADSRLQPMMVDVAAISGYTPSGKSLAAGAKLLKTYSPEEIIAAFKEHVSNLDDFGLKRSIQTFFEGGGGEVIILLRRKRELERQDMQNQMAAQEAIMRAERDAERMREAAEQAQADEDLALVLEDEPTAPSGEAESAQEAPVRAGVGETIDLDDIPF